MKQVEYDKDPFYKQKWFKLLLLFLGLSSFFIFSHKGLTRNLSQLEELKVITQGKYRTGGDSNPTKIYFNTKEYSNPFGIGVGGIYGRSDKVEKALEDNRQITIKIHKDDINKLNTTNEAVSIYYLYEEEKGLIFNEKNFNEGRNSSFKSFMVFLLIGFIILLWIALRN
jgi:hypothetical protein